MQLSQHVNMGAAYELGSSQWVDPGEEDVFLFLTNMVLDMNPERIAQEFEIHLTCASREVLDEGLRRLRSAVKDREVRGDFGMHQEALTSRAMQEMKTCMELEVLKEMCSIMLHEEGEKLHRLRRMERLCHENEIVFKFFEYLPWPEGGREKVRSRPELLWEPDAVERY